MSTPDTKKETHGLAAASGKYLTFALGREEYGLQILKVREIIGQMEITAVPRTPAYVKGVINLRGQVIAVIDLRTKFGMPAIQKSDETCIIVVEITSRQCQTVSMGIIVDRVSEVVSISAESVEGPPSFGTVVDTDFIFGMGKIGKSVKILLDINKVLTHQELSEVSGSTPTNGQQPVAA